MAQSDGALEIEAREHAVTRDVRVDDGRDASILEALPEVDVAHIRGFGPALHGHPAVAGIDADRHFAGKGLRGRLDEIGVAQGRRADDDAGDAPRQPGFHLFHAADAPAELHRKAHALEDRLHRRAVHGLAREGAVEIDDMQGLEALRLEARSLRGGVIVEDGCLRHVALLQANALAVLEVDGGVKDHGRHARKFWRSRRPSCWLFSGWNCVPTMFSRPTMAETGPP